MIKGFYNLTSAMLTQGRRLDVISNNMTNVSTAGYKADEYLGTTFDEVLFNRVGNKDKSQYTPIGNISYILTSSEVYTDYKQGLLEDTNLPLNFAIEGDDFFGVRMDDDTIAYTRAGNFSLDEEGYLCLPGLGRVLSPENEPIRLMTDDVTADAQGNIFTEGGAYLGTLGRFVFEEMGEFERNGRGLFITDEQPQQGNGVIHQRMLERSNVDLTQQMVDMISAQRALQSAAQVAKMYDSLMTKATGEVGKL